MEQTPVPNINDSEFQDILNEAKALVPFYTPEWATSGEKSPGTALLKLFAHMLETSIRRLNKVPDKNFIAFLDMLGIKLVPAQPARVPLTFLLSKGATENVLIPERTQAAAGEITFETETNMLATPAKFTDAYSLNIGRDGIFQAQPHIISGETVSAFTTKLTYAAKSGDKNLFLDDVSGLAEGDVLEIGGDGSTISKTQVPEYVMISEVADTMVSLVDQLNHNHNAAETVSKATIFELFEGRNIQEHILYLGHKDLFNIKPPEGSKSSLSLSFTIQGAVEQKPALEWSHWGENKETEADEWLTIEATDGTSGLTKSGVVTLAIASEIKETEVNGIKNRWLRARVRGTILKNGKLPIIDTVSIGKVVDGVLVGIENTLSPDMAFHNDVPLDLTLLDGGAFKEDLYPFGKKPRLMDTFYLGSKEAFSKKEATISLNFNVSADSSTIPVENIHGIGPTFSQMLKGSGINTVDQLLQRSDTELMRILNTRMKNRVLNIMSAARKTFVEASRLSATVSGGTTDSTKSSSNNDNDELALSWEYWNGKGWIVINDVTDNTDHFRGNGTVTFDCPSDIEATQVSGQESYWIRVRIASGDYGKELVYDGNQWVPGQINPPGFSILTVKYSYLLQPQYLEHCLTYNNLEYIDVTEESKTQGKTFPPFKALDDEHHTLYLGFDKKMESGPISIFFAIEEPQYIAETPPRITWEYFAQGEEGGEWLRLQVLDKTKSMSRSGTIEFIVPDDSIACSQFGQELYWIRAMDADDRFQSPAQVYTEALKITKPAYMLQQAQYRYGFPGTTSKFSLPESSRYSFVTDTREVKQEEALEPCPPSYLVAFHPLWAAPGATPEYSPNPRIEGIYLNTTWALQMEMMKDEILGSSDGEAEQTFTLTKVPVTSDDIWVNEFNALSEDEIKDIVDEGELEVEKVEDDKGNTTVFWIKWTAVDDLLSSTGDDRHYEIDRISGTVNFGDGTHGAIPPIGTDNIKADYWVGGGKSGNVDSSKITSLKTSVAFVDKVSNPVAAEGGSDTEEVEKVLERGPQVIRHRNHAVTREDFEWLVKQASPGIARAKCLPNFDNKGEHTAGWVTVIIVPESEAKQPTPTLELKSQAETYLKDCTANTVVSPEHLQVSEPVYVEVGVEATIVTTSIDVVPEIENETLSRLEAFLHPLTGGFDGEGWDFGKAPCLSDFFALLEAIPDVDHVDSLEVKVKAGEKQTLSELTISPDEPGEIEMPPYTLIYSGEHEIKVNFEKEV